MLESTPDLSILVFLSSKEVNRFSRQPVIISLLPLTPLSLPFYPTKEEYLKKKKEEKKKYTEVLKPVLSYSATEL